MAGALSTVQVDDSVGYLVYRMAVSNDPESRGPIAIVAMDLSDVREDAGGTSPPPSSGNFRPLNIDALPPIEGVSPLHTVPVGPDTPEGWTAYQADNGSVRWVERLGGDLLRMGGVDPGSTLTGFALRSEYLPGIREVRLAPAWHAIFDVYPDLDGGDQYITHEDFSIAVPAALPTWKASELDYDLIEQQLTRSCTELGWITNSGICNSLQVKLNEVVQALESDNYNAAAGGLRAFSHELDALNVKFISGEAYYMLKLNSEALADRIES